MTHVLQHSIANKLLPIDYWVIREKVFCCFFKSPHKLVPITPITPLFGRAVDFYNTEHSKFWKKFAEKSILTTEEEYKLEINLLYPSLEKL